MQNPNVDQEDVVPAMHDMHPMGPAAAMHHGMPPVDSEMHPMHDGMYPMHDGMRRPHLRGYVGEAYPAWFHHHRRRRHHPMHDACVEPFDGGAAGLLLNVLIFLILILLILKVLKLF
jgi:hypothetical protein